MLFEFFFFFLSEYQKKKESTDKWNNMPIHKKLHSFMSSKLNNMKYGLQQIYMAVTVILEMHDPQQPSHDPQMEKKEEL